MALAGAVVGLVVGIGVEAIVDPSEGTGNEEYAAGQRIGFVLRYVVLGAIGFALTAKVAAERAGGGGTPLWAVLGACAVVLVAVLPPVLDRDGDDRSDPRGDQFEAGFLNGCLETSPRGVPPDVARRYCECLLETLGRGRDASELERLARATRRAVETGAQPPAVIVRASRSCARRAS
jgi:hypothetical protein